MPTWLDSLIGAGGAVASGAVSAGSAIASAKQAQRFVKKVATRGPSWQVEGLQRAGLNPILAATGGRLGGGVGGAVPQAAQASIPNIATSALDARAKSKQVEILQRQADAAKHLPKKAMWEAEGAAMKSALTEREVFGKHIDNQLRETLVPSAKAAERLDKTKFGEALRYINRAIQSISPFVDTAKKAVR